MKSFGYSIPGLIDNAAQTYYYYYNSNANDSVPDGALTSMMATDGYSLNFTYDTLGRMSAKAFASKMRTDYTFLAGNGSNTTTTMVSGVKNTVNGKVVQNYQYQYDKLGNITQEKELIADDTTTYSYDVQGQLLTVYNPDGTRTENTYDTYGNIRSKNTYTPFNDLWDGYTYTYGDSQWKDLLTGLTVTHNGKSTSGAFTYDQIGNPLTYFNGSNWTFTWRNGRQLATAKTGTKTTRYEYNADGLRTRKVNADGTYADYYWVGSTLLAEVQYKANGAFTRTLMFLHDEKGAIVGVGVKNAGDARFTHYYYAKNLQGDVVAIYRSDYTEAKGYYPTLVASYEYDPWGKVTSVKGSSGAILSLEAYPNHIAHVNPIRYRGYYYDIETGFYYLQSRYYDPVISRFINADSYGSTGQAFLGTNMFAYCLNNPIMYADAFGTSPAWWQWAISGVMVVAGVVLTATGVGGAAGGALICAGANSIVGSYTSEASGGSSVAGWTGGMITGALSGYGAGKAGTMFIAASDLTGTACLSQVALGGVTSFGFGAIGAGAGTITTAAINGQKLNAKDIFSAAVTGGAINMLAGIASAIGSGVYKMPAISETSKVAASALSTSWSIAAEAVCDAVSALIGLIAG